jgi:hypothetical protein
LDFKFRAIELLELYINKSKNIGIFIEFLPKLMLEIKNHFNDKTKSPYCHRILNMIKQYLDKSPKFTID